MAEENRSTEIYRNDGYSNCILDVMNQMRNDVLLCDVTLITNDGEIPSHKMILAGSSHYFHTIFTNAEQTQQNKIILKGINSETLSSILDYVYTSEVEITDGNVQDILSAANLLLLTDLRDACLQFLKNHLHSTNCLAIRANVDLHDFQDLLKDVEDFILENFTDVAQSQEFLQLSHEDLSRIMSKDELNIPSEEKVFECILIWIRHDLELRQKYLASLMRNVRICFLSREYITKTFLQEQLLNADPECKDFIIEGFKVNALKLGSKSTTVKRRQYVDLSKTRNQTYTLVSHIILSVLVVIYFDLLCSTLGNVDPKVYF